MRISDWSSDVCSSDVLTVIEGMAELEQQPASMLVSASEQLVVLPDGEHYKNVLDPAAAERTAEWTTDYFNTPPEREKKKMSKGAKTALGILGAIILGKAIHDRQSTRLNSSH